MPVRRTRLAAAAVLMAVGSGLAVNPVQAADRGLTWTPCPEDAAYQCTTLAVPIDWDRPRGATIDLALIRRPATDPTARIGSLVVHFGGSGTGVDDLLTPAFYHPSPDLARRFDIVAYDARGEGRSGGVRCSAELWDQVTFQPPENRAEFQRTVDLHRRFYEDCRQRTGPVYDHISTAADAQDLDAIRAALGESTLTFYGLSAGSLLGQHYAERYPQRIRALALDAIGDHSLGIREMLDISARAAQDGFEGFVDWCDRTPTCALHGRDTRTFWNDLLARIDRGEIAVPGDTEPLRADQFLNSAQGGFDERLWAELAQAMLDLAAANPTPTAGIEQAVETVAVGRSGALTCNDYSLPVRSYADFAGHLRRTARLAPDVRFGGLANWMVFCLGAPAAANPQRPLQVRNSPPLLLINSLHDPVTAYPFAVNVARQLGDQAVLLTYEGWGHGAYFRSPCTTNAVDDYLISLTLPAPGIRCPAVAPA